MLGCLAGNVRMTMHDNASQQRKLWGFFNVYRRRCYRKSRKIFGPWEILLTQPVGTESKCAKDAENVYAPNVMVSIGGREMTLAGKTVYQNGSFAAIFGPPPFSLDSIINRLWYSIVLKRPNILIWRDFSNAHFQRTTSRFTATGETLNCYMGEPRGAHRLEKAQTPLGTRIICILVSLLTYDKTQEIGEKN